MALAITHFLGHSDAAGNIEPTMGKKIGLNKSVLELDSYVWKVALEIQSIKSLDSFTI